MSNERIESWLNIQRKMVEPGGEAACKVILVGPDNDVWATWALEDAGVHRSIDDTLMTQGEDLPRGTYRCKLVSLDARSNQLAMLPVRVTGRSANDLGAGGEAQALQRATGMLTGTFEQVLLALTNRDSDQEKRINSLIEDRAILLEEFNKAQTENLDVEFRREEHAERMAIQREIRDMVKDLFKLATPTVVLPAIQSWAEEQNLKREDRVRQLKAKQEREAKEKAPFPPGYPGGNTQDSKPATQGAKDQSGGSSSDSGGPPSAAVTVPTAPPPATPSATLNGDGGPTPTDQPPDGAGPDCPTAPPRPAADGTPGGSTDSRGRSTSMVKRSPSARRRPAGAKR